MKITWVSRHLPLAVQPGKGDVLPAVARAEHLQLADRAAPHRALGLNDHTPSAATMSNAVIDIARVIVLSEEGSGAARMPAFF